MVFLLRSGWAGGRATSHLPHLGGPRSICHIASIFSFQRLWYRPGMHRHIEKSYENHDQGYEQLSIEFATIFLHQPVFRYSLQNHSEILILLHRPTAGLICPAKYGPCLPFPYIFDKGLHNQLLGWFSRFIWRYFRTGFPDKNERQGPYLCGQIGLAIDLCNRIKQF